MTDQPSKDESYTGRAIALVEDAEGSYRAEWSECSNKTVDLARDADAEVGSWTDRAVEMASLLAKWVLYCDLSGVKPVSGDLRDNPILALIADTRATLGKPVPSSGHETPLKHSSMDYGGGPFDKDGNEGPNETNPK